VDTDKALIRQAAGKGFCVLLAGIGLGRFGYPPLIPLLVKDGWFTAAQADYLGAWNLAGYVAGSAIAGVASHHMKTSLTVRIALVTVAAGFFACAFPLPFLWFVFWRLAAGVSGAVLMVIGVPSVLAKIPPAVRGRSGGLVFTGVGAGMALSGTVIPVFAGWGLRDAWLSLGVASVVLAAFGWRGWETSRPAATTPAPPVEPGKKRKLTWILFWLLAAYVTNAIGFVPHTVFWVDFIARGLHRGIATGNHYWVLLGISAAMGPTASGWLADRIGFSRSLRASLFAKAIGVGLPLISTSPVALALSSIGVGSMAIGVVSLAAGRVAELVPLGQQKRVWGWMTAAFAIGHAASAFVLSAIFAATGSYRILFSIGSVTLLIGCVFDFVSSRMR
jgi:predicted MFS family arabinose efflux permease